MKINKLFKVGNTGHIYTFFFRIWHFAANAAIAARKNDTAKSSGIYKDGTAEYWFGYRDAMGAILRCMDYDVETAAKENDIFGDAYDDFKEWLRLRGELEKFGC